MKKRYYILIFLAIFVDTLHSKDIFQLKNFNKYDIIYAKEYKNYFSLYKNIYSWKIIKAQSIQESLLNPTAKSYVGAFGLMQLMPKTYKQLKKQLKLGSIADPRNNIKAGVYYDKKMFNVWKSKRTIESRYKLMFASYNAGAGHLIKAQKQCLKQQKNCNEYKDIEKYLHLITGRYSNETKTYVKYIFMYYKKLNASNKKESLLDLQFLFSLSLADLINYAYRRGYTITMGEIYRTKYQQKYYVETGKSKTYNSRHLKRLAADMNLFKDRKYLTQCAYYEFLGNYWEKKGRRFKWGGHYRTFKDCPHFEIYYRSK
jgi:hypothetical protein